MKKLICIGLLLSLFSLFVPAAGAASKSYYYPSVTIDMTINKDAGIDIVEKRTFRFNGSFTFIYWEIPLTNTQAITNVAISDDETNTPYTRISLPDDSRPANSFSAVRNGNIERIEAYHRSVDMTKTFTLSYHLTGAITKYQDEAQLYWKVIGDKSGARTDAAVITVHLPQTVDKKDIYVWGHGPLNGQAEILDGKTTRFTVANLPSGQFVEIRELFPATIIEGAAVNQTILEKVKQEELGFQQRTKLAQGLKIIFLLAVALLIIGWIAYWYRIWYKFGKEYRTIETPKYTHFPPTKLQPALVEALLTQHQRISPNSFSATILDLARKKILKIEALQKLNAGFLGLGGGWSYKYILHLADRKYQSSTKLEAYEKSLIAFIFEQSDDGKSITIDDLKNAMKSHPTQSRKFFNDWSEEIKKLADTKGFLEPESKKWQTRFIISNILFIVGLFFVGVILGSFVFDVGALFGVAFIGLFPMFFVANYFLRWKRPAEMEARQWEGFKRYLNDFSHFKSEIPQAVVIWEEMLVYGTMFGIAKKVAEYLPLILQQTGTVAPGWYYVSSSHGGTVSSSVQGLGTDFATSFASSISDMSSAFSGSFSSGSGGGFSGGGGGGGGGGGSGAG